MTFSREQGECWKLGDVDSVFCVSHVMPYDNWIRCACDQQHCQKTQDVVQGLSPAARLCLTLSSRHEASARTTDTFICRSGTAQYRLSSRSFCSGPTSQNPFFS